MNNIDEGMKIINDLYLKLDLIMKSIEDGCDVNLYIDELSSVDFSLREILNEMQFGSHEDDFDDIIDLEF